MPDYSAGNLELKIQAVSENTIASLSSVNQKLLTMMNLVGHSAKQFAELQTSLSAISRLKFNSLTNFANGLNKLSEINSQAISQKISSIGQILSPLKELNTAGIGELSGLNAFALGLNKIVKVDVETFDKKIQSVTTSLRPFLTEITTATPALNAFATAMTTLKGTRTIGFKSITSSVAGGNKVGVLGFTNFLNKIYFLRNYTSNLFRQLGQGLQNAIDFTETLNLWQVAMRGNRAEAEKFVTTMNRAYGISEQTLMNYQAIFRNMLTSLGGISENTTYALSEYLTQMALDYASLYNTTIEKAMTTFQSVLSGQVRPIRSIAGYDITETTIYQLYQQLGGTKTQRALSQTEKRLLRIYAVFQQMDRSGAIGDLRKTLESTANQMRVMDESIKELTQWFGIFIEQAVKPALPYINAFLITVKDIAKALALASGYKPPEFGVESVQEYNNELDELQGKLLSFDRFEALNTAQDDNALAIDSTILSGLEQYQSILSGVTSKTQDLVNQWHDFWFTVDENGVERLSDRGKLILDLLTAILITFGVLAGYGLASKVVKLAGAFLHLNSAISLLSFALTTGIIFSIIEAVRLFKEGDYWGGILASTIGVALVAAFVALNGELLVTKGFHILSNLLKIKTALSGVVKWLGQTSGGVNALNSSLLGSKNGWATMTNGAKIATVAMGALLAVTVFSALDQWFSTMNNDAKILFGTLTLLTSVIAGLTIALLAMQGTLSMGVAVPLILASVGAGVASMKAILQGANAFKNGGLVEDGLFTMSKGEIIGNFDDGTTVVANNQQIIEGIRQGVYGAVVSAFGNRQSGGVGDVYLDGRKVGIATAQSSRREQVRVGMARANK